MGKGLGSDGFENYHRGYNLRSNKKNMSKIPPEDLFLVVRPTLVFGKFLGLFPYMDLVHLNKECLPKYKKWNWSVAINHFQVITFSLKSLLYFASTLMLIWDSAGDGGSSHESIEKIQTFIETVAQMYLAWIHCVFWFKGEDFCQLFSIWREQCGKLDFVSQQDGTFKRRVSLLLKIVMTSAILENLVNSTRFLPSFSSHSAAAAAGNMTALEAYYGRENGVLAQLVPYNIILLIVTFVNHKLAVYSLNLISILVSVMAYALGQKFKFFVQETSAKLDGTLDSKLATESNSIGAEIKSKADGSSVQTMLVCQAKIEKIDWTLVREDYVTLCNLVRKIDEFASPMIFFQVGFFVQWICITIYRGLTAPKMTILDQIYTLWAFGHLTARILILILAASHIVEQAQKVHGVLQKCPKNEYCQEIERLERLVAIPVGLTGLGCFTVSRSLILSLANVIFTIEIVLLQASGGNKPSNA